MKNNSLIIAIGLAILIGSVNHEANARPLRFRSNINPGISRTLIVPDSGRGSSKYPQIRRSRLGYSNRGRARSGYINRGRIRSNHINRGRVRFGYTNGGRGRSSYSNRGRTRSVYGTYNNHRR